MLVQKSEIVNPKMTGTGFVTGASVGSKVATGAFAAAANGILSLTFRTLIPLSFLLSFKMSI